MLIRHLLLITLKNLILILYMLPPFFNIIISGPNFHACIENVGSESDREMHAVSHESRAMHNGTS